MRMLTVSLRTGKPDVPNRRRSTTNGWLMHTCAVSCALFIVLMGLSANGFGQQGQASISGNVEDNSGALLAGARITLINKDTAVVTKTTSTDAGRYTFLYVPVGTYNLQAEKEGFRTEVKTGLILTAEQQAAANFTLRVGQVSEKVEVSANSQAVETESASGRGYQPAYDYRVTAERT
jgi:hypothetical protein